MSSPRKHYDYLRYPGPEPQPASQPSRPEHNQKPSKLKQKLGSVLLALTVATGVKFGYNAMAAGERKAGHERQIEVVQIDKVQRARLDAAASDSSLRLLGFSDKRLDFKNLSVYKDTLVAKVSNGNLTIGGTEIVDQSLGGYANRRLAITFDGAPQAMDASSIATFLQTRPHVEQIHTEHRDALDSYQASLAVEPSGKDHAKLTINVPEDEGYKFDMPPEYTDFYTQPPVDRALDIANGIRE